jgi:hypothetical protein
MTATDRADFWLIGDDRGGHITDSFDEARNAYDEGWTVVGLITEDHRIEALREAAEIWRPWTPGGCPTCEADPMVRKTRGLICQTCGHDYGEQA